MAKRHLSVLILALIGAAGCQQPTTESRYAPPSFATPQLASDSAPPVAPPPPPAVTPFRLPPPAARAKPRAPAVAANVPRNWVPPVPARPWRWIVIHHSDSPTGGAAAFDLEHRQKGWDELGYDFVIGNGTDTGDGQIEVGPRWTKQKIGAHAKTLDNRYNEYGIGICLVGNMMDHPPTPKQMAAVERLTAYLMDAYRITPDHILGHGDTKATLCPGRFTNLPLIRTAAAREAGVSPAYAAARPTGELLVQAAPGR